ncbi:hypothetical protein FACS1894109_06820 [Spirochaetia bacterium]|nr:hypothetical protein FACS1894109_06820 [Spirochaetia bacterium]
MDLRAVFNGIAKKLLTDFEISSQIPHGTDKGTFREGSLRKFLEEGKMPKKYSLGHGQIITRKNEISKSIDIIIFDNIENSPLIFDESTQIFPIESVYGIIECKSHLSKDKLLEGLENIKSVKSIAPRDYAIRKEPSGITSYPRSSPFGIIFAYSLGDNSIDSIERNISEWEKVNDPKYWPNLVVVLNEALIFHRNTPDLNIVITNEAIKKDVILGSNRHKDQVFFNFYIYLMDMCSSMQIGGFNLRDYFNLPERMNDLFVKGNDHFIARETQKMSRLKYDFLKKVYEYCDDTNKSNYVDVFKRGTGTFIFAFDEKKYSKIVAYLYNPDNYPGVHEVSNAIEIIDGIPKITKDVCFPWIKLEINDKLIFLPWSYVIDEHFEIVE